MVDFEAKRVLDLFKDEDKTELKEGITTRDINSIASMTPLSRQELQVDLQKAYKLVYDKNNSDSEKLGEAPKLTLPNLSALPTMEIAPLTSQTMQQKPTNDKNEMAEQFMDMYKKIKENKEENKNTFPNGQQPKPQLSSYQDYVDRIKELENLNIEKDNRIEALEKDKEELLNQQYELENKHLEKYKELNNKYEDLKDKSTTKTSSSGDDSLVEYLKQANERLEQKQSLLLQEIGKLKGMLGI